MILIPQNGIINNNNGDENITFKGADTDSNSATAKSMCSFVKNNLLLDKNTLKGGKYSKLFCDQNNVESDHSTVHLCICDDLLKEERLLKSLTPKFKKNEAINRIQYSPKANNISDESSQTGSFISIDRRKLEEEMRMVEVRHKQIIKELSLSFEEMLIGESGDAREVEGIEAAALDERLVVTGDSDFNNDTISQCNLAKIFERTFNLFLFWKANERPGSDTGRISTVEFSSGVVNILEEGSPINVERYSTNKPQRINIQPSPRCTNNRITHTNDAGRSNESYNNKQCITDVILNCASKWKFLQRRDALSSSKSPQTDTCEACIIQRC